MHKLIILAIFLTLNFTSFGQEDSKSKGTMIFKVYDDYSNVGVTYTIKMECSGIKEINADTIISIDNSSEIEYFQNKFKNLKRESSVYGVDVRVKVWIQVANKESILCFGRRGKVMKYNGDLYSYDTELVQRILAKLDKVEAKEFSVPMPKLKK